MSLEQPNSPQILLEQAQPAVDVNLALQAEPVADGIFEVCVTATVTTKVSDKTLFLVEAKQAGIFEIRNIPDEQLQPIIGIACPQIVLPLPACHRGRRGHAGRLPSGAPLRGQLPGHVRGPASPGPGPAAGPARQHRQWQRDHPERLIGWSGPHANHRVRRGRLGHRAGHPGGAAPRGCCCGRVDAAHANSLQLARTNPRYLPGVALPPALQVTHDWATAVRHAGDGLAVLGTPMDALEAMLRALPAALPVVWLCKGFQAGSGRLGHEVAQGRARIRRGGQRHSVGAPASPKRWPVACPPPWWLPARMLR